jgi:malate dehydrogenase (oxaloacetate-decarboxylating)(NADP+)
LLKGLGILEMKKTNIEKYQYLSVLRNTNVHLFYRLLSNNVKVRLIKRVGMPRSEV